MAWNAEGLKKKMREMTSNTKKRPINNAAANALGGLSGKVVKAKKKRKKALEDAAKGL